MNPDELKPAWHAQSAQPRLTIDADVLLNEVRRTQSYFNAIIFLRDVREVGVSLLLIPVWIYMGIRLRLPWTWYLTIPALLWIAGFMLIDRARHTRRPQPSEPLRQSIERSLAQVEHQIWLLRNVAWWYLLPPGLTILVFFAQVALRLRAGVWQTALFLAPLLAVLAIVWAVVYWVNQLAVRSTLIPRREELRALLTHLHDGTPADEPK